VSRIKIRHGGVVKCDMVTVTETESDVFFENECEERFTTYSLLSRARKQAKEAGWVRKKVARVAWPGLPPAADAKKVDLCPAHALCVAPITRRKKKDQP